MKKLKRVVLIILCACICAGCFSSCEKQSQSDVGESQTAKSGNIGDKNETVDDIPTEFGTIVKRELVTKIDAQTISLGDAHGAAITSDGSLYMWGFNGAYQLGNGTQESSSVPIKIMDNVASVSLGRYDSAAITTTGELYMWGKNFGKKPKKIMDNVMSVSVGGNHYAALTTDGTLYSGGFNKYGQVGCGETDGDVEAPIKIMDNVKKISLCDNSSAAIKNDGTLYVWGDGSFNRYLEAELFNRIHFYPLEVAYRIGDVCLGADCSATISSGKLYMWGQNGNGQLGLGSVHSYNKISDVMNNAIMDNVVKVSLPKYEFVYGSHSAAITEDGSLYMFGSGMYGQIGNGKSNSENPTPIKIMDNIVDVSLGDYFSAAVTKDGELYTWGLGSNGQLGNGETKEINPLPIKIMDNIMQSGIKEFTNEIRSLAGVEAYVDILESEYDDSAQFALAYIDDDSIPELLVFKDGSHVADVAIYTYKDSKAVLVGNAGSYGNISYLPRQNVVYSGDMHMGYSTENFYCIKDGSLEKISSFFDNESTMEDPVVFKVNDQEVSEEEYNTELNKMKENKKFTNAGYGNKTSYTKNQGIPLMRENYRDIIIG